MTSSVLHPDLGPKEPQRAGAWEESCFSWNFRFENRFFVAGARVMPLRGCGVSRPARLEERKKISTKHNNVGGCRLLLYIHVAYFDLKAKMSSYNGRRREKSLKEKRSENQVVPAQ